MNKIKSFIKKLFYKKKRLRTPPTEKTFVLYSKHNDLMSNSRAYLYSKYRFDNDFSYSIVNSRLSIIQYNPYHPIDYMISVLYNVSYSTEYTLLNKINANLKEPKWWD